MQPSSFQMHKLNVLVEYKELCSRLYQLCRERFPEYEELMAALVHEKESHIRWIQSQEKGVESGTVTINPNAVKVEAMRFVIQAIRQKMEDIKRNSLTSLQILLYIRETENTMLEKNFFQIFENSSVEFKTEKMALESEDQRNLDTIQSALSERKRSL